MAVQGQRISQAIEKAIRRMRTAGASIRQIAAALGVSTTTVQRVVKTASNY